MDPLILIAIAIVMILAALWVFEPEIKGAASKVATPRGERHTIPGPPNVCPDCRHLVRQCCDSILGEDHMQACQWRDGLPRYMVDTPAGRYWQEFHNRDELAAGAMNATTSAELWSGREDAA